MIENDLFPFLCIVAFSAFITITSAVHVIDVMARHALLRQILITLIGMAAVARRFFVLAS